MPETTPSYNYCAVPLALYACRPDLSKGRLYPEAESVHRTCFQRDRDRIIHSAAFRRLNLKSQVFDSGEGDHYRTRLSHSLEVAQVARTLARIFYVNEDLAEAIALAHDLGHPAFAHRGEDALEKCMEPFGGFKHNDQTVRVLTVLEHRYPEFHGLNLCYETLEGLVKHNGPALKNGQSKNDLPFTIKWLSCQVDFKLDLYAHLEAQVVDLADDTAYFNHDIEDGLRAGFFSLNDLNGLSIYADFLQDLRERYADQPEPIVIAETIRTQFGAMVDDAVMTTRVNLAELNPQSPDDVRHAGRQLVRFSSSMFAKVRELREFLYDRMYRSAPIKDLAGQVEEIVADLFKIYMNNSKEMPEAWQARVKMAVSDAARARIVADYIAGMTDRYAHREHERLYGVQPDLSPIYSRR